MAKSKRKKHAPQNSMKTTLGQTNPILGAALNQDASQQSGQTQPGKIQENTDRRWVLELAQSERKVFSQMGQDGVIEQIFKKIGTRNNPPFCVEFGFNSKDLTSGTGANTANLVENHKWRALLLDGGHENPEINLHKAFLTSANICDIFAQHKVPIEPEYISVDIDSCDLWLLKAILGKYKPLLVSTEFNSNFPLRYAITFPNDPGEWWQGDSVYGASLKALTLVAREFGYELVYVAGSVDAFFIRGDMLHGLDLPALEHFWEQIRPAHGRCGSGREKLMLDYEVFLETQDLEKSRAAALPVATKYLVDYPHKMEAWESAPSVTESDFIGQVEALIETNNQEAALEETMKGLAQYPTSAPLLFLRGHIFLSKAQSRFAEAEDSFRQVIAIIPWHPLAYQGLAQVSERCGEWLTALQRWEECLEKFPTHLLAGKWLAKKAEVLIGLSRYQEAEQTFKSVVALMKSRPMGYLGLARTATLRRDWLAAADYWGTCLKYFPKHRDAVQWRSELATVLRLGLADVLSEAGQFQGAATEYKSILQGQPEHIEARKRLAILAKKLDSHK